MGDIYKSIAAPCEGLYKELGSRFIALAWPVESEDEVKELIEKVRREYHDARHCCFAWRLGLDGALWRASDDGEPSSSAGRPILGQIDSAGLSDILVVVVRYFGGIKLGVPGLIRAYRSATRDALDSAVTVEKVAGTFYDVSFGYMSMNPVMKMVKDLDLPQSRQAFGERCSMRVKVRLTQVGDFMDRVGRIEDCEAVPLTKG